MNRSVLRLFSRALSLGVVVGMMGCASSPVYLAKQYQTPRRVAVLPMSNETNDLDGPVQVRSLIQDRLMAKGWSVIPLPEIDAKLKEQGFTDGGQLRATTPQKLGEWLGADAVLYSWLEDFSYINVGFYAERVVKVRAQLVDTQSGTKMWEAERNSSTKAIALNKKEAEKLFATQLAIKAVELATHRPLQPESVRVVLELINTLP